MPILDLFAFILRIINSVVVPFIFTIAFLVFIWGIFQAFIAGNDDKRKEGRKLALYGIIGFFLMVSVWGLVNVLVGTFGFGGQRRPPLPGFGSPSPGANHPDSFGDLRPVGSPCDGAGQCADPGLCEINGITKEGICVAH